MKCYEIELILFIQNLAWSKATVIDYEIPEDDNTMELIVKTDKPEHLKNYEIEEIEI